MESPHDQNLPDDGAVNADTSVNVPIEGGYEEEEMEVEGPRRAASAEFIVETDVGSEAALREAMDPANQSLAEALRLSFRVLQVVMVLLLLLFAISGFTTVEEDQTGVKLLFGRIVSESGQDALTPGAKFNLPYPVGEFVIVDASDTVNIRQFDTRLPETMTREQAIEQRTVNQPLTPGLEGTVITSDGGLAHLRVDTTFAIEMPRSMFETIKWDDVRDLVRLSVQHAVVKTTGRSSLDDLIDRSAAIADEIRMAAQTRLDDLGAGVRLTTLNFPDRPSPPLAIERSIADLADARERANTLITNAQEEAVQTLITFAGPDYQNLVDLIESYEEATRLGDDDVVAERLAAINEQLESKETSGIVANVISMARDHRTTVAMTLGTEAQQFQSLFPAFQQNPDLVVAEQWLDAYQAVFSGPGVETIKVPGDMHIVRLNIYGSDAVMNERRDQRMEMAQQSAFQAGMQAQGAFSRGMRGSDMNISSSGVQEAGRMLDVTNGRIRTNRN